MRKIILIIHNVRSVHNVGSLLRSADGFNLDAVYLTGYSPYPQQKNDRRLPHLAARASKQLHKTALGAEQNKNIFNENDVTDVIQKLQAEGFTIAAVEQTDDSKKLPDYQPPEKIVLIVGREVEGIETDVLKLCDLALEIPMSGQKESFNVSVAGAIALYHCKNQP